MRTEGVTSFIYYCARPITHI